MSISIVDTVAWLTVRFTKFFGSGVIIATAFIHLLAPAWDSLTSACLVQTYPTFGEYPWAAAIALMAVYFIFFAETAAYRAGTARLAKLGISTGQFRPHKKLDRRADKTAHHGDNNDHPTHTHTHADAEAAVEHHHDHDHAHSPNSASGSGSFGDEKALQLDDKSATDVHVVSESDVAKQIVGVAVLEFGVILHS